MNSAPGRPSLRGAVCIIQNMSEALLNLHVERLPEGDFLATSDDLPGLLAQGRTMAETLEIAQDVARKLIEAHLEHGDPLPPKLRAKIARRNDLSIAVALP